MRRAMIMGAAAHATTAAMWGMPKAASAKELVSGVAMKDIKRKKYRLQVPATYEDVDEPRQWMGGPKPVFQVRDTRKGFEANVITLYREEVPAGGPISVSALGSTEE